MEGTKSPPHLSETTLRLLVNERSLREKEVFELHPQLAQCWENIIKSGLEKEDKKNLLGKYPRKGNYSLFTPKLHEVLSPLLNKSAKSRDRYLSLNQDLCGLGLTALGITIGLVFNEEIEGIDKDELLELLCNSIKYFCELMRQLSVTRRVYVSACVDAKWKPLLDKTEAGEELYDDLVKKIKAANAAEKLGHSLKTSAFSSGKKSYFKPKATLNWKGPPGRYSRSSLVGYQHAPDQRYPEQSRAFLRNARIFPQGPYKRRASNNTAQK